MTSEIRKEAKSYAFRNDGCGYDLNTCEDIFSDGANWAIDKACEAFCLIECNGKPPRSTCTSLGTCEKFDFFVKAMKGGE